MHRELLLNLLYQYEPEDKNELVYKKQIIHFIKENSNCFERINKNGHITASCWLLDQTGNKALLMHHRKLNKWLQLGGHCDGNPDVLQVAIKEATEESGINDIIYIKNDIFDIDIHLLPTTVKEPAHYHYDIRFLLQVNGSYTVKNNEESNELRWVNKDITRLPTYETSVIRMFKKWINIRNTTTSLKVTTLSNLP